MLTVRIALLAILFGGPVLTSAAPVCWFPSVPCFFACGNPPPLTDSAHSALWLRPADYTRINWLDQSTAAVTTQFFKCFGINGWRRYRFRVYAAGTVQAAATSWDGLRTVDISLTDFDNSPVYRALPQTHYIRAEVIRRVWAHLPFPVCAGDQIRVQGELHWDGHGFLEVHPSQDGDVQFLQPPAHLKKCPPPKGDRAPGGSREKP